MAAVLFRLLPLFLGAIAPVGIGLVILLLVSKNGLIKAIAYMIAQGLAFAIWGILFLTLSSNIENVDSQGSSQVSITLRIFLGILLLILAIRTYFSEHDLEALPLKLEALLDKIGVVALFFLNLILSFFNLRFVMLIMIGTDMISAIQMPTAESYLALLILILFLLLPQMVPIFVFVAMRNRKEKVLESMNAWVAKNARLINASLLGILGVFLLLDGLVSLINL